HTTDSRVCAAFLRGSGRCGGDICGEEIQQSLGLPVEIAGKRSRRKSGMTPAFRKFERNARRDFADRWQMTAGQKGIVARMHYECGHADAAQIGFAARAAPIVV